MKSSLSNLTVSNMNEEELENHRKRAYHEQDIYIFTPEQRNRLHYAQRLELESAAIQIYGRRKGK